MMSQWMTVTLFRRGMLFVLVACALACGACDEEDRSPTDPGDTSTGDGWEEIASPVSTHLYGVGFLSSTEGWIVGQSGTVLRSTNQGENWTMAADGITTEALYDVDFVGSTVYICGSETTLLKGVSTESGYQWSSVTIPNGKEFYRRVQFAGTATGWVLETTWHFGLVRLWYLGSDGLWAEGSGIPYEEDFSASDFCFTSNMLPDAGDNGKLKHEGWLLGYSGDSPDGTAQLYRSANGGKSWSLVLEDPDSFFKQIHFIDDTHGWIAKTWGMLSTTDGGATWQSHDFTSSLVMPQHLFFTDRSTGWVAMPSGTLHHTTDGGASWTEQKCEGASLPTVSDMHMLNATVGVLACRDGKIYRTTSGGQ